MAFDEQYDDRLHPLDETYWDLCTGYCVASDQMTWLWENRHDWPTAYSHLKLGQGVVCWSRTSLRFCYEVLRSSVLAMHLAISSDLTDLYEILSI